MIERLSTHNEAAALEFLERRPHERVVVAHLVLYGSAHARNSIAVTSEGGEVRGVGYFGNEILLAGDESTAPAFASFSKSLRRNGPANDRWSASHHIGILAVDCRRAKAAAYRARTAVRHARRPAIAATAVCERPRSSGTSERSFESSPTIRRR